MAPAAKLAPTSAGAGGVFGRGESAKAKPHGVLDPHDINNAGFFALFALIGVGFVLTGI